MNVDGFLRSHDLTLDDVTRAAVDALRIGDDDVLFVGGSLVDGIGNETSDLDLFLLTDRTDLEYTSGLTDIALNVGDVLLDVRVLMRADADRLVARFDDWFHAPRVPRHSFEFTPDERKFLYRLSVAVPLAGAGSLARLQHDWLDTALRRHKLDWARHLTSTTVVDLVGLRAEGDHDAMMAACHDIAGHAFDALLAGHGKANPNSKWRIKFLRQIDASSADPDGTSCDGMPAAPMVDRYLDLVHVPRAEGLRDANDHAIRVTSVARRIFVWAESAVLGYPRPFVHATGHLADPSADLPPALDVDVDIRWSGDSYRIARLSDPLVPPTAIGLPEAEALLRFDGVGDRLTIEQAYGPLDELTALVDLLGLRAPRFADLATLRSLVHRQASDRPVPADR